MNTIETIRRGYVDNDVISRFKDLIDNGDENALAIVNEHNEREARTKREPSFGHSPSIIPTAVPVPHPFDSFLNVPNESIANELSRVQAVIDLMEDGTIDDSNIKGYKEYMDNLREELNQRGESTTTDNKLHGKPEQPERILPKGKDWDKTVVTADTLSQVIDKVHSTAIAVANALANNTPSSIVADLKNDYIEAVQNKNKALYAYTRPVPKEDDVVDLAKCSTGNLKSELDALDNAIATLDASGDNLGTDCANFIKARSLIRKELRRRGELTLGNATTEVLHQTKLEVEPNISDKQIWRR